MLGAGVKNWPDSVLSPLVGVTLWRRGDTKSKEQTNNIISGSVKCQGKKKIKQDGHDGDQELHRETHEKKGQ